MGDGFTLIRDDAAVADCVRFIDGTVALRWVVGPHRSTALYDSMEDMHMVHVHDHEGTSVDWAQDRSGSGASPFLDGGLNCILDENENVPFSGVGGLDRRNDMTAPEWDRLEDPDVREQWLEGYRYQALVMYGPGWRTVTFSWHPVLEIGGTDPEVTHE